MEETNSPSASNTPPALPDRSKSVSEITVNRLVVQKSHTSPSTSEDTMGEYYDHLGKHVQEVRRRRNTDLVSPKLFEFQEKKGDTIISTKWVEFIEAVNIDRHMTLSMLTKFIPSGLNTLLLLLHMIKSIVHWNHSL